MNCPDCAELMLIEEMTLYDNDANDIDLYFFVCNACGYIHYNTNIE